METCNECVYQPICYVYSNMGVTDIPASDTTPCEMFKSKADFIERAELEKLKVENQRIRNAWTEDLQDKIRAIHEATEQAYKNGYSAGVKEFGKLLIDKSENGKISICDVPDFAIEIIKIKEVEKKLEILISKHFKTNDIYQGGNNNGKN